MVMMVSMILKNMVIVVRIIVAIMAVVLMATETTVTMVKAATMTTTVPSCGLDYKGSRCFPTYSRWQNLRSRLALLHHQSLLGRAQTSHRADCRRQLRHNASVSATCVSQKVNVYVVT